MPNIRRGRRGSARSRSTWISACCCCWRCCCWQLLPDSFDLDFHYKLDAEDNASRYKLQSPVLCKVDDQMADTVVTVQDRAEAAVIAATSGCRQALAKIGGSIATCRVPQWTWKVSATPPNVTRTMIRRYQYHQPGALAEGGGQELEDTVVPDIVETLPNVQIRAVRGPVLVPRFVEKDQRAHNKRCIPLQNWRLGDFYLYVPIW